MVSIVKPEVTTKPVLPEVAPKVVAQPEIIVKTVT